MGNNRNKGGNGAGGCRYASATLLRFLGLACPERGEGRKPGGWKGVDQGAIREKGMEKEDDEW